MKMKNQAGMVLTEALVAVATLATATIILGSMFTSGVDSTKTSKDYLQAQNLLIEGLEAIKNLRNSNWLIKPDKPECWLVMEPSKLIENINPACNATDSADTDIPYLVYNNTNQWSLKSSGASELNLEEGESGNMEKYRLHIDKETSELLQNPTLNNPSKFYRSVKFLSFPEGQAEFEVKIQWADGAKTRTVKDTFILSNYLK